MNTRNTYEVELYWRNPEGHGLEYLSDKLFEHHPHEAYVSIDGRRVQTDFYIKADSLSQALQEAITGVKELKLGLVLDRIGPSDNVQLIEIARRSAVTRQSVNGWKKHDDFPDTTDGQSLYSWAEVTRWGVRQGKFEEHVALQADEMRTIISKHDMNQNPFSEYEPARVERFLALKHRGHAKRAPSYTPLFDSTSSVAAAG